MPDKLHGLFLTLFDPTAGIELDVRSRGPRALSRMQFEVPEGVVSHELPGEGDAPVFEIVKEYLIPKDSLYGHLVTVCTRQHKVIGFPGASMARISNAEPSSQDRRLAGL